MFFAAVDLWQEYAQFIVGSNSLEEAKKVLDKAINAAGLHVNSGSLLWDSLREIELAILSSLPENTEKWKEQLKKVADTFKRQLSVPLLDMENTYEEFKIWLEMLPSDHGIDLKPIEWGYQKALKSLDIFKPFEERLLIATNEEDKLHVYREYIKIAKDTSMVLCLYERAVAEACLNVDLWEEYCLYCLKLGEVGLNVSKRALRNCTWSESLWIIRLRILEFNNSDEKLVLECFEQGKIDFLVKYKSLIQIDSETK